MALTVDIMRGGTSAGQAQAINGQVNGSVAAAGSSISDATDLTASINVVTSGSGGVQLYSAMIGDEQEILNISGVQITVYPDSSSARINNLSAGSGFVLANNTAVKCRKFTSTRWIGNLSA